ncbi:MAG: tRNA (adenosine(37)-N6)-dimethylallyltransferase MiaA [Deltaproteobacteria bacterium]|nr:tRNA (adenosine(37)-N6)-dimethylallyltransferase MiaA [Deltaproteobacteria bacterium]
MDPCGTPKPRLILLLGPTGAGKTALALRLAERFGGEIVGADSMQVYRGMDIGTAKPTTEERKRVPHHLLDVVAPDAPFDVSLYCELARTAIAALHREEKRIFVVGGTGLYLRALVGGLIDGPAADETLRQTLKDEMARLGKPHLYEKLRERDPRAAARIHPQDGIRIVRALEVLELTGRSIVDHQQAHRFQERPYEVLKIGLLPERERLWAAIDGRTEQMMARGFLDEVRQLLERYDGSLKAMQSLGYRHLVAQLAGKTDLAEAVRLIKADTRRYAKRQLTWFTADPEIHWQDPDDEAEAAERIAGFLK